MVLSLFINAIITLLCALKKEYLNQLVFWQMGSFSGGSMKQNAVLLAVLAVCVPLLLRLFAGSIIPSYLYIVFTIVATIAAAVIIYKKRISGEEAEG